VLRYAWHASPPVHPRRGGRAAAVGQARQEAALPDPIVRALRALPAGVLAAALAGGAPPAPLPLPPAATLFRDGTATHVPAAPDLHALGAALVDVDGDRDLDVALAVEGGANRLYLNDGRGRLTWREGALGTAAHDSEHVLAADFDRDGRPDLLFVAEDDRAHQLFLGAGGGRSVDASDRLPARSVGNGLAVGDVNGDGLPDVVVGNTGEGSPGRRRASGQNFLWLNDPRRPGHFVDATATHLPPRDDDTQDVDLADLDGDGNLDLLVANEVPPSRRLLNDGRGRFADASARLDLRVPMETRQAHVLDATGDGRPDVPLFNLTSNARGWAGGRRARMGDGGRGPRRRRPRRPVRRRLGDADAAQRSGGALAGGRRCRVACSYAYASWNSVGSLHARPKRVSPAGSSPRV
jgi:hypothetical protein